MSATVRARLLAGERLAGTVLTLPGAAIAELLADPFDVVWVDLEHAALGPADAQDLILGAQAAGAAALVRVPAAAHGLIATMLDAGADGVVLASVDTAQVAADAVAATRHPPLGRRGYGPRRAGSRGRRSGRAADAVPTVWAQIETRVGVAHTAAIAQVDGIDAVVAGTADLSLDLGTPLDLTSPPLLDAVAASRAGARDGRAAFGLAGALLHAPIALTAGAQVLIHSTDARLCAAAVDDAARRAHALLTTSDDMEPSTR